MSVLHYTCWLQTGSIPKSKLDNGAEREVEWEVVVVRETLQQWNVTMSMRCDSRKQSKIPEKNLFAATPSWRILLAFALSPKSHLKLLADESQDLNKHEDNKENKTHKAKGFVSLLSDDKLKLWSDAYKTNFN